jgi:hypothetical protein
MSKESILISSQVPLTTQPPFHMFVEESFAWIARGGKCNSERIPGLSKPRTRKFAEHAKEHERAV